MSARESERIAALRRRFESHRQEHVLRFLPDLSAADRERFLTELEALDLTRIDRLVDEMRRDVPIASLDLDRLEPAEWVGLENAAASGARARALGEELLRQGKVAALVVAGGQGTRLGFDGPKGCFTVGPLSRCSLFAWHAYKVRRARQRYGANIPFLVLTSEANDAETRRFFEQNDWFGLPASDVILFRQGMLPAVDLSGRLLLERKDRLALAPDGHGGTLTALESRGVLAELESRGIEEIFYFQVDNPLVRVLDAEFLGHHRLVRSQMASKACAKRDPGEKVGVFAAAEGRTGIIEYSDLPAHLMNQRDAEGRLLYRAGNIAVHVLSVPFVRELTRGGLRLPYHRAIKAVPFIDERGTEVKPTDKNAVKFETFIFDALPLAERTVLVEASRFDEFSPIKNKSGEDSPESALRDLDAMFRRWIEAVGARAPAPLGQLEIAPTFALDHHDFERRVSELARGGALDLTRSPLHLH